MATSLKFRHLYAGVPGTVRGEPTHLSTDPSGATDRVVYPAGRVAVIRSLSDPLDSKAFSQHSATVTAARFSPNGEQVATADDSGNIRIWNADTLEQKLSFDALPGSIRDIAFTPDAKFIVAAADCRGAFAKVFKTKSGGSVGTPKGHSKRVAACDAAEKLIATGSEDMTVGLFVGPPVREIDIPKFLRHPTAFVNDVRFSPDGSMLAIASSDRLATVVDVLTAEVKHTFEGHVASVTGVCWVSNDRLVTSANDKSVKEWSLADGSCLNTITYGKDVMDMQVGCAYSQKSDEIVSISLRPQVNIRQLKNPSFSRVLRGHSKQIIGVTSVDNRFYSADYSGLMVSWENDSGPSDVAFNGKGPTTSVCAIAANSDVVVNVGQDGKVYVTPTDSLTYSNPVTVKGGGVDIAVARHTAPEFSTVMINESRLAAISASGDAIAAELSFERGETGTAVAINPDGTLIAVGVEVSGGAGQLRFYTVNGEAFKQAGSTMNIMSAPNRLAFSPDGELIAVGEKGRRVKMYNCTTRSGITGGGTAHTARVDAICFSPDGTQVASGGMDGSVAVWPVDSEDDPIKLKTAHRRGVTGISFISTTCLVTSGGDSCIRTWDL